MSTSVRACSPLRVSYSIESSQTERTALLAAKSTVEAGHAERNGGRGGLEAEGAGVTDSIPVWQVTLLNFGRLLDALSFFIIFPFVNQMVSDNGALADTDVGFYSGLIESVYSLTAMTVMVPWGRAADRYGRKPVLLLSILAIIAGSVGFGFCRTILQMLLVRGLWGACAGAGVVTIRTMLAEHSKPTTQARIFSWFAFAGNIGIILGAFLGGALVDPAKQYHWTGIPFFVDFPYALPGLTLGGMGLITFLSTVLYVTETLPRAKRDVRKKWAVVRPGVETEEDDDVETSLETRPAAETTSIWHLIRQPGVATVLYVYCHAMMLAFALTAVLPVFLFTPVSLGGLGFSPSQTSIVMCTIGVAQGFWLLVVFPPLQNRIGTNGVLRLCGLSYPFWYLLMPLANVLMRQQGPATMHYFWAITLPLLAVGSGVSMSFTAVQLALNDISPGPHMLSTLNSVTLATVSGIRAFMPVLFSSLYAAGARTQWLGGYAIWVLMIVMAMGFAVVVHYLPDYEAIKKRREAEESLPSTS